MSESKLRKVDIVRAVLWTGKVASTDSFTQSEIRRFPAPQRLQYILYLAQQELEFKTLQDKNIFQDSPFQFEIEHHRESFALKSAEVDRVIKVLEQQDEIKVEASEITLFSKVQPAISQITELANEDNTVKRWFWKIRFLGTVDEEQLYKEILNKKQNEKFIREYIK